MASFINVNALFSLREKRSRWRVIRPLSIRDHPHDTSHDYFCLANPSNLKALCGRDGWYGQPVKLSRINPTIRLAREDKLYLGAIICTREVPGAPTAVVTPGEMMHVEQFYVLLRRHGLQLQAKRSISQIFGLDSLCTATCNIIHSCI